MGFATGSAMNEKADRQMSMRRWLLPVLLGLAALVWLTGQGLPAVVASHFAAGGMADGYMPRTPYLLLMLALVLGLPAIMAFVPLLDAEGPAKGLNLPNRDYWLDPARRGQTIRILNGFMARFACALAVLLAYTHLLVVRANQVVPPHLAERAMITGLVLFVVVMLFLSWRLVRYFRRVPGRR